MLTGMQHPRGRAAAVARAGVCSFEIFSVGSEGADHCIADCVLVDVLNPLCFVLALLVGQGIYSGLVKIARGPFVFVSQLAPSADNQLDIVQRAF